MRWNYHRLVRLAGVMGVVGLSPTSHAQEAGDSSNTLTEIIVTAEKREERLQDVPVAVTVVSAAQLANEHVYNIVDLARTTPSLEMVQAFGGPGGGGQIRGIGTTSFTRSAEGAVGIVVDGVPQGNINVSNIFDMQRVEVLKGPQGTLFGLTSSAGVINMVTVAPDSSKFESKVHVDYSDNGKLGSKFGEATVRAVVNAPITDTSAIRVSVTDDRTKGVQVNNFSHDENVATDWSVRARYRLKPSDEFEMNIIADYARRGQNYNDPQFTYVSANPTLTAELASCDIAAGYGNRARCGNNANDFNSRNYGVSAQFDIALNSSATLTSITGYRKDIAAPNDADIMGSNSEFVQIFSTGLMASGRQFSQELRIGSTGNQTVDYTAGLFYADYLALTSYAPGGAFNVGSFFIAPVFVNFAKSAVPTRTTGKSDAAFGQILYHMTDPLGLIAGMRLTHQVVADFSGADAFVPATVPTSNKISQNNVSGKLGLQFKIDANLTSYFTVTRGYKGPQVQAAAGGNPAVAIGAEIPTAFELGLKGSLFDRRLGFDSDVFYSRVHEYQGQRCSINPIGALACLGESIPSVVSKGVELNAYGQVATGLNVTGGYIYNVAQYPSGFTGYDPKNLTGGASTDLSHRQIVGVPKNKVSLSADYAIPLGVVKGFINADTVYKSALRLGPTADPRFVYPAHFNTGMRFGVRSPTDRWSAALFVRNLSNNHEPVTLFGGPSFTGPGRNPAAPLGEVNGVSGWMTADALRQVGLSFDAKF